MEGKDYILSAPHLSIFPGLIIMMSVLSFNIAGDGLGIFRNRAPMKDRRSHIFSP